MARETTKFVEYKEELLPKCIPAIIDDLWYPPVDEDANPDKGGDDDNEDQGDDDITE